MSKMNLRVARVKAGLDKAYVAEQVQVSQETLTNWEKGKTSPEMQQGAYLAMLYGVKISDIDFSKEAQQARA